MEKDLKFRVWDLRNKNISEVNNIFFTHDFISIQTPHTTLVNNYPHVKKYPDEFVLMEYSGFIDYNGRNIFEFDILKCDFGDGSSRTHIVMYQKPSFSWLNIRDWNEAEMYRTWAPLNQEHINKYRYEIIGNYFNNPELMKYEEI